MKVFGKEHEVGDILATAKFRLYGTGHSGNPVDEIVRAELCVSGASQYGNQTCTSIIWEDGYEDSYDTRYDNVSPDTFTEFASRLINHGTLVTIKVEAIDDD